MPKGKKLDPFLKDELRAILDPNILDMSQKEWANEAGVAAALVSNLIGSSDENVRDPERIDRLARVLEDKRTLLREAGQISPFNEVRVEEVVYELRCRYRRVEERYYSPAGGTISTGARNFIYTKPVLEAMELADNPLSLLMIRGPRFSGATTLASAITRRAAIDSGFGVPFVDWALYKPYLSEAEDSADLQMRLLRLIIQETEVVGAAPGQWLRDNTKDAIHPIALMKRFVQDGLIRKRRPAMIVFDSIDVLSDSSVDLLSGLISSVKDVVSLAPKDIRFVLVGHDTLDDNDPLSRLPGSRIVRTGNLTREEVDTLALKTLRDRSTADRVFVAGEVWTYFHGQPFMTHSLFDGVQELPKVTQDLLNRELRGVGLEGMGRQYTSYIEGLMRRRDVAERFQEVLAEGNSLFDEWQDPAGRRLIRLGLAQADNGRLVVSSHIRDSAEELYSKGSGKER